MEREKLGLRIAQELEAEIVEGRLPVGHLIGSELDLTSRFRASRDVVREAVRLLEHLQLAEMKRGRSGGLVVKPPAISITGEFISTYLDFADVATSELDAARLVVEVSGARLAAGNHCDVHAETMQARKVSGQHWSAGDRFHLAVADGSQNPAVALFVRSLISVTNRRRSGAGSTVGSGQECGSHDLIAGALERGQTHRAASLMRDHLTAALPTDCGDVLDGDRSRRQTRRGEISSIEWASAKLPERIAFGIRNDILARGWPVGHIVGSESALMERYAVSRGTFREAVGILEYFGAAEMRRGAAGGLMVGEPRADRILSAVSVHLDRVGLTEQNARDVSEALVSLRQSNRAADFFDQVMSRVRSNAGSRRTW